MLTLAPPRRAVDYGSMKIVEKEGKTGNYLVYKNEKDKKRFVKFVFNDFKLSSKKGSESFAREYMENLPNGG